MCGSMSERWVLCPWFEEHGDDTVHRDDLARLRALRPYGKVFRWQGVEAGYQKISYGSETFKVAASLLQPLSLDEDACLVVGETVSLKETSEDATITSVQWHHQEKRPFFHIARLGKKSSRRYWLDDFAR